MEDVNESNAGKGLFPEPMRSFLWCMEMIGGGSPNFRQHAQAIVAQSLIGLFLGSTCTGNAAQFGDLAYRATASTITITKYAGSGGAVTIPSTINGVPVTSVGEKAFQDCTGLTSLTIPHSVTGIGDWAFLGCSSQPAVYFQGNCPSLGRNAFVDAKQGTVYCSSGTTGWGSTFSGRPTRLGSR